MNKVLKALKEIQSLIIHLYDECEITTDFNDNFNIIEKELKLLQLIKSRGIILRIPENDYSEEHFDIHIYTNTMSFEEICEFEEIML